MVAMKDPSGAALAARRFAGWEPLGFEAGDNNWYRFVASGPTGTTDPFGLEGMAMTGGGLTVSGVGPAVTVICTCGPTNATTSLTCPNPQLQPANCPRNNLQNRPLPNAPAILWNSNQARIIEMTALAGNNPTDTQFLQAIHEVNTMMGSDSALALGAIIQIRDSGIDNPLLASLDHYFNARNAVETSWLPGLMFAKVLAANAVYCGMKAVDIPVPRDSLRPASPATLQQWMAGNHGAADGILHHKPSR